MIDVLRYTVHNRHGDIIAAAIGPFVAARIMYALTRDAASVAHRGRVLFSLDTEALPKVSMYRKNAHVDALARRLQRRARQKEA